MSKPSKKAVILGAGPLGLIAAERLAKEGYEVDIYEKLPLVGGMCRSWNWGEFILDTGPHIFHTPDKDLQKYWETEFGDLFIQNDFWCKNVQGDNFDTMWDYPISWESISKYPQELKKKILNEIGLASEEKKRNANTYKDFIDAQVGPTLRKMFFEEYPEKLWGIPPEEMSALWAPKRIQFRKSITPFYHEEWNAVGKYGTGSILNVIKDNIIKLGGRIHLESTITGFSRTDNVINSIQFKDGSEHTVSADDIIISSLPITLLARFFGHNSDLKFRGICTTYLSYDKESILPEGLHWLYYGSKKVHFNRISEPKKMSRFVCPQGKTYLAIETTYSKGDKFDMLDTDQMMSEIADQVELVGLAKADQVTGMTFNKEDFVYPVQYVGHQEELTKSRAVISKYNQLHSLGTGGEFYYSDIQILFHKAWDLVDSLCGKKFKGIQTAKQIQTCKPNQVIDINGRKVGSDYPAYIIAEAGLNHNASKDIAKKLIDKAVHTGCDAIKFQTYLPNSRVSKKVKAAKYAEKVIGLEESLDQVFSRLAMSFEDQVEIFNYAKEKGLEVFSTPFDLESVDFLEKFGVSVYKIASMDLVNLPLIRHVAKTGKPIIISTGMSTLGQIEDAVHAVLKEGNSNLMLLHCNSTYPAAPEEMNLKAIQTLKSTFNVPTGLSDHTFGLFVSHTALVLGANIIERHYTLDRTMEGPDHILSSEPAEMAALVEMAKSIPIILGDGVKTIQPNEYIALNQQRKGIYSRVDIKEGQLITQDMLTIKGPGGAILPKYLDIVIGRTAKTNIESDLPITWEKV
ncbi:N-acetylneuraminate synthase family protein [Halobacteriovorax sp. HLS]|uniref:N-acetylneuraminate synthase family protein n=1 Tax=Halobacteriovorax sp. HLS TaxID=2234000 RepID=UPI000FD731A1|nr:N-acetylneuraminate synthase family protein [Halobacteriovorax sp. HLS]